MFTSETAREAGKKSKRPKQRRDGTVVRECVEEAFKKDAKYLIKSLEALRSKPQLHIEAWSKLLPYIAPKLAHLKMESEETQTMNLSITVSDQKQKEAILHIGEEIKEE